MQFENRASAGLQLSILLLEKQIHGDVVITLPRGGIPVALVIAQQIRIPLKLIFIRKIGHPMNLEYAIGAVSSTSILMHNHSLVNEQHPEITTIIEKERNRIAEMKAKFNHEFTNEEVKQKNIILVDDGIATGSCIELAIQELRKNGAKKIIVATPVCPFNTYQHIKKIADEMVCGFVTQQFTGISAYYHDFQQLSDEQVAELIK